MNKTQIPISKKWDFARSYEQLKQDALFCYWQEGDQYPVKLVMEQTPDRIKGVSIGHYGDGIIIAAEFSAPVSRLENPYNTSELDTLICRFLSWCEWWDQPCRATDNLIPIMPGLTPTMDTWNP